MIQTLSDEDVVVAREVILARIASNKGSDGGHTQALGGPLEIILLQAVIPILVALTSSVLGDVIKGKMLTSIRRREAEQVIDELLRRPLVPTVKLEDESFAELHRLLSPMGLLDNDIKQLYQAVRQQVELNHGQVKSEGSKEEISQSHYPSKKDKGLIKILFLAANPRDTSPLRLGEEVRTIDERLRAAQFRDRFELVQHHALRITDLADTLLRHQPHIVHFSGHGSSSGQIILEDLSGSAEYVTAAAIARLFRILKDNVRCVVLNACFSITQASEIIKYIDCVIGTSRAIGDEAAIRFASGFYRGIGFGRNVETAFELGCNEIDLAALGEEETPQLLSKEGVELVNFYFTPDGI